MKKHLLHGVGMALLLASPIWITFEKPPSLGSAYGGKRAREE
jgi:hypothetical protein